MEAVFTDLAQRASDALLAAKKVSGQAEEDERKRKAQYTMEI